MKKIKFKIPQIGLKKRPSYKRLYEVFSTIAAVSTIIAISAIIASITFWKTSRAFKESQNIMVWQMDESCFDQIQNSSDGTIRLKIK